MDVRNFVRGGIETKSALITTAQLKIEPGL